VLCTGIASEAAGRLPALVPRVAELHSTDKHLTDLPSWEQHISQGPVQVWHQATSAVMSHLPKLFPQAPRVSQQPVGSGPGAVNRAWQYCQQAAGVLPTLVATAGTDEQVSLCCWSKDTRGVVNAGQVLSVKDLVT